MIFRVALRYVCFVYVSFLSITFSASLTSWLLPSLFSLSLLLSFFSTLLSTLLHAIFLFLAPLLSLLRPYFSLLPSFSFFSFIFSSLLLSPLQSFRYSTVFPLSLLFSVSFSFSPICLLSFSFSHLIFSLLISPFFTFMYFLVSVAPRQVPLLSSIDEKIDTKYFKK